MPPTSRDLASEELWQRSLERSRHRRELAPLVRKTASRRKRLSLAVSAAVAAAPAAPSLASAGGGSSNGASAPHALSLLDQHSDPILLELGATGPSVAQVQKALQVPADGVYGQQTQAAVRAYQQLHGLPATGSVDVKTWLTLFPNDMVIATPSGWSATTSAAPTAQGASHLSAAATPSGSSAQATGTSAPATPAGGSGVQGATAAQGSAPATTDAVQGSAPSSLVGSNPIQGGETGAPTTAAPTVPTNRVSDPPPQSTPTQPGGTTTQGGTTTHGGTTTQGGTTIHSTPPASSQPQNTAAALINKMIGAANRITAHHYAYSWGGGHNPSFSGPYDCSGAVSAVLHAAGLLSSPMVSGDFVHWGAPGPGAVTLYANSTHVYMSIRGRYFGTSESNPGGGAGWFNGAPRPGFAVVHVPVERMHLSSAAKTGTTVKHTRLQVSAASHVNAVATQPSGGRSAEPTPAGGASSSSGGVASQPSGGARTPVHVTASRLAAAKAAVPAPTTGHGGPVHTRIARKVRAATHSAVARASSHGSLSDGGSDGGAKTDLN